MLNKLKHTLQFNTVQQVPVNVREAVEKMDLTINRMKQTQSINLLRTDYLE